MLPREIASVTTSEKIIIVGIGDDGLEGLTIVGRGHVEKADVLIGTEHTLQLIGPTKVKTILVDGNVDTVAGHIADHRASRIVVLATGDPLFFGVARYLCEKIGKDRIEVVPNVSTMQLAFARVKESWDEAYLTNLATQGIDAVVERMRTASKVGLFTTESCPPGAVAAALMERGIDYFTAYVCENLGSPNERVTRCELADLVTMEFSSLNVMVLVRKPNVPDRPIEMQGHRLFGNPDEAFLQSKPKRGLITSSELRVLALAEMDLGPASNVWDVGAGSGSVAIEAAQLAPNGTTYAIEMDSEDYQLIVSNAERFAVRNLVPVLGQAPEAWADLPDPDAIFIGGTGRAVGQIVALALKRLKKGGRLVANVASIESLSLVHEKVREMGDHFSVRMIQISHGNEQLDLLRFESMNPSYLVSMVKPE